MIARLATVIGILVLCFSGADAADLTGKKVLYVDSYHAGYAWSEGVLRGVQTGLKETGVVLKTHHMDTKLNKSEAFKKTAALKVKALIESYQPDVVIASDDNASKYLIKPYYKDAALPFVFCGVNWTVDAYGYPYSNVTGVLEINGIDELIRRFQELSGGKKLALLANNNLSARKNAANIEKVFGVKIDARFVDRFADWKKEFLALQKTADILILANNALPDWDDKEGAAFAEKHSKIPSGAWNPWMMPYVMMGFLKIPEEQGERASALAIKILNGAKAGDLPIERNTNGRIILNARVANAIGIQFPPDFVEIADKIIE